MTGRRKRLRGAWWIRKMPVFESKIRNFFIIAEWFCMNIERGIRRREEAAGLWKK